MKDAEKQGADQAGFCPEVLETFLTHASIVLESQDALYRILQSLVAGQLAWALCCVKVLRYSSAQSGDLLLAVEQRVYAALSPVKEVAK